MIRILLQVVRIMVLTAIVLVIPLLNVGSTPHIPGQTLAAEPAPPAGYGTFTGQIVLDGEPPVVPPLVNAKDPRKDPDCCRGEIPDERFIVDVKTGGIRNVFVYLVRAPAIHPDLQVSSQAEVEVGAEQCRYQPHALVARTDQVILFKAADACVHNTHAFPLKTLSSGRLPKLDGSAVPFRFRKAEPEPFPVKCDFHPWMKAHWLVLDHPYAAITDETGKFRIDKLPAGEHQFVIWHEAAGLLDKGLAVTIKAEETTDNGVLKVSLNKFKL